MNELEKLRTFLLQGKEHNDEHAKIYRDWAEKASSLGNREVSEILDLLHYETRRLNRLIEKAIKAIG